MATLASIVMPENAHSLADVHMLITVMDMPRRAAVVRMVAAPRVRQRSRRNRRSIHRRRCRRNRRNRNLSPTPHSFDMLILVRATDALNHIPLRRFRFRRRSPPRAAPTADNTIAPAATTDITATSDTTIAICKNVSFNTPNPFSALAATRPTTATPQNMLPRSAPFNQSTLDMKMAVPLEISLPITKPVTMIMRH